MQKYINKAIDVTTKIGIVDLCFRDMSLISGQKKCIGCMGGNDNQYQIYYYQMINKHALGKAYIQNDIYIFSKCLLLRTTFISLGYELKH